jgi:transposase-like protein
MSAAYVKRHRSSIFFAGPLRAYRSAEVENKYLSDYRLILKLVLITQFVKKFRLRRSLFKIIGLLNSILSIISAEQLKHQHESLQYKSIQEFIDTNNHNEVNNLNKTIKLPKNNLSFFNIGNQQYNMQSMAVQSEESLLTIKSFLLEIFSRFPRYRSQLEALFQRNLEIVQLNKTIQNKYEEENTKYNELLSKYNTLQQQNHDLAQNHQQLIEQNKALNKNVKQLKHQTNVLTDKNNQLRLYVHKAHPVQLNGHSVPQNKNPATNQSAHDQLEQFAQSLAVKEDKNNDLANLRSPLAVQLAIAYNEQGNAVAQKLNFDEPQELEATSNSSDGNQDDELLNSLFFKQKNK